MRFPRATRSGLKTIRLQAQQKAPEPAPEVAEPAPEVSEAPVVSVERKGVEMEPEVVEEPQASI